MKSRLASLLTVLVVLAATCLVLAGAITALYAYDGGTYFGSVAGIAALLALGIALWFYRRRLLRLGDGPAVANVAAAILVGMGLGMLWAVEIGINNILAPLLPVRDLVDDLFWGAVALAILGLAIYVGFKHHSLRRAVEAGAWSGLSSGLVACLAALVMIVFGMGYMTRDPVNLYEWAYQLKTITAPTMADYFAYQAFAGAFLHLLVLGIAMGALLGVVGGMPQWIIQWRERQKRNAAGPHPRHAAASHRR